MRKNKFQILTALLLVTGISFLSFNKFDGDDEKTDIKTIELGTDLPMPKQKMKGIDGEFHKLKDFKKENGTLVIFSACSCPFVIGSDKNEGWEKRYDEVYDQAEKSNVGMVLVNSNEAKRKGADSYENMKKRAEKHSYDMEYLYDSHHKVADAFGAKFTPHVFLFNKEGKLVYKGAIDDNVRSAKKVEKHYLLDALKAVNSGSEIPIKESRAIGCSIKRK